MVKWVGAGGTCCSDGIYRLLTYNDATDTWQIAQTPLSGSGHSYDGNALDPLTGDIYFTMYMDRVVHKYDGKTWSGVPDIPSSAVPSMAMEWFPEINGGKGGLVHVNGNGNLAWYDGTKWTAISGGSWGEYNLFAQYNPVQKVVWLGAGNGAEQTHYKLDAQLLLTKLKEAPFSLNNGQALHSVDPAGGMFIVTNLNNGTWWTFDVQSDTWTQISNMKGTIPSLNTNSPVFQVPIKDYGVILYFQHSNAVREVYLYKHTAGSGTSAQSVKPPLRRIVSAQTGNIKLYDLKGRMVRAVNQNDQGMIRQPTGLNKGVYLMQTIDRNKRVVDKVTIIDK
jgi:hypothetical protein